jgi:hypothetical protein
MRLDQLQFSRHAAVAFSAATAIFVFTGFVCGDDRTAAGEEPIETKKPLRPFPRVYDITLEGGETIVGKPVDESLKLNGGSYRHNIPFDKINYLKHDHTGKKIIATCTDDQDHYGVPAEDSITFLVAGRRQEVPWAKLTRAVLQFPHRPDHDAIVGNGGFLNVDEYGRVISVVISRVDAAADLPRLRKHKHIRRLKLSCTCTDDEFAAIGDMPALTTLWLYKQALTDRSMAHVARFENLEKLWLYCPQVTDAGIEELVKCKKLRWLYLINVDMGDAGLVHVGRMVQLKWLKFQDIPITDRGLPQLQPLTKLEFLGLVRTKITGTGTALLKELFPDCRLKVY